MESFITEGCAHLLRDALEQQFRSCSSQSSFSFYMRSLSRHVQALQPLPSLPKHCSAALRCLIWERNRTAFRLIESFKAVLSDGDHTRPHCTCGANLSELTSRVFTGAIAASKVLLVCLCEVLRNELSVLCVLWKLFRLLDLYISQG